MTNAPVLRIPVDNVAEDGPAVEHGFSVWIEAGSERLPLDTGAGGALAPNARRLGVDLARASAVVLSRGHYDHTGGLPCALSSAPSAGLRFAPGTAPK